LENISEIPEIQAIKQSELYSHRKQNTFSFPYYDVNGIKPTNRKRPEGIFIACNYTKGEAITADRVKPRCSMERWV